MARNKPRRPDSQYLDIHTGKDLRLPRAPWTPSPVLPWGKLLRRSGALPATKPAKSKKGGSDGRQSLSGTCHGPACGPMVLLSVFQGIGPSAVSVAFIAWAMSWTVRVGMPCPVSEFK